PCSTRPSSWRTTWTTRPSPTSGSSSSSPAATRRSLSTPRSGSRCGRSAAYPRRRSPAFLVPQETMAKRLVPAKHKIKAAGIPFSRATDAPASGPPRRGARRRLPDLQRGLRRPRRPRGRGDPARSRTRRAGARRARGARLAGAHADQRRPARRARRRRRGRPASRPGSRARWDLDQIAEGRAALDRALALGGRDAYVLQAAIAALHVEEPQDWPQLAALYDELARRTGSPVVKLNQA